MKHALALTFVYILADSYKKSKIIMKYIFNSEILSSSFVRTNRWSQGISSSVVHATKMEFVNNYKCIRKT